MIEKSRRVENTQESYIRNILKAISQPGMLSLAGGLPDASRFPFELLANASQNLVNNPGIYQYGPTEGLPALREWILAKQPQGDLDVLLTTGSQQALDLLARAYLNPQDKVLVEAPSYLGALQIFDLAEVETVAVLSENDGPNIADLERQLKAHKVKLFYAVPDFQNPSCRTWSAIKRQQVAELLAQYDVAFVEDAPYRELRFEGQTLPTVSSFMQQLQADSFFLGSFSKIATPSMRVGYVSARAELLKPIAKVKQASDLHSALPMQQMLLDVVSHPDFDDHLQALTKHYQSRRDALVAAVNAHLSEFVDFEVPEGGMFLWLELKRHNARDIAAKALVENVAVVPGTEFWPSTREADYQAIRLNFTALDAEQLDVAVARLAKVMAAN
ncbi:PLP-dependent aminotransferase family protein [Paraferrimonas sp. SM1919]|uniref:aminotransferase-like domain-containing protein n=1 Tax=Paraferrimonas sp. SM1919 TaxID=2662263 RepID=UPI0013D5E5C5|nr:PLP-dependent aminotransferase family protein [Paraferrimonas sp. SM1919]